MLKSIGFCLLSIFCHCLIAGIFVAIYLILFPPKEVGIGFLGAAYVLILASAGQGLVAGISFMGVRTYPVNHHHHGFNYFPYVLTASCVSLFVGIAAPIWLALSMHGNFSNIPLEYFIISTCHSAMVGLASSLALACWLSSNLDFTQSAAE